MPQIMDMAVYQPDHAHMMQTSGHMDGVGSHIEYTDSADLNRRAQMEQQPHQQVEMRTGTTSFAQGIDTHRHTCIYIKKIDVYFTDSYLSPLLW